MTLRFSSLLERLTELREVISLRYQIFYKGCNSGTAKGKRNTGQAMGKWGEPPMLFLGTLLSSNLLPVNQLGSSSNPILLGFYGGFIHRHD